MISLPPLASCPCRARLAKQACRQLPGQQVELLLLVAVVQHHVLLLLSRIQQVGDHLTWA